MMGDSIAAFFEQLAARGYEPLLHSVSGTYRFDIEDQGSWGVIVKEGAIEVTRKLPKADCVFISNREIFKRILQGEQNPTTAFMQGKVQVIGSLSLAQLFQRLFRIRPETSLNGREKDG
jgi:putative sterol carrier protein